MEKSTKSKKPLGAWLYDEEKERLLLEFDGYEFPIADKGTDISEVQKNLIEKLVLKIDINKPEAQKKIEKLFIVNKLLYSLYDESEVIEVMKADPSLFIQELEKGTVH